MQQQHLPRAPLRVLVLMLLVVGVWVLGDTRAPSAQPRQRYAGLKPAELVERSRETPSVSERVAMRVLLAEQSPKSPEGMFARAWLARYEGDADRHRELIEACVALSPSFPACVAEQADLQAGPARVAAYEQLLQLAPEYNHSMALRNLYFARVKADRPGAEALLKAWEGRPEGAFIVPFIRGLDAEHNAKDYVVAERLYGQALRARPRHFEAYKALADLRLHHLTDGRTPIPERMKALEVAFTFIAERQREPASWQRDQSIAEAWLWIGDQARGTFKDHPGAFQAYARSFAAWPTGEAGARAGEAARHYDQGLRERFLLEAQAKLPQHSLILSTLGYAFQHDPARAERFYREAVAAAQTPRDAVAPARFLGQDILETRLDFDGAAKLYREHIAQVKDPGDLPAALYENRRCSGDFAGAAEALRAMAARSSHDLGSPWYQDRLREVESFQVMEAARATFYRANPFLEQWRARWGESVRVKVNFASGSSAVAARDRGVLAELARALTAPGAEGYVFQIEGHTDDQGEASANRALSKARADAVIRYLHATHKIPLERMSGYGAGEDAPLEPNTSAGGRAANRRVEIVPMGAVERPTLAVTGAMMPQEELVASPDGRLLALGRSPVQLWDAQRNVKLRDLGRGARLTFSPNGRWVAAASSFVEAGGYRSTALFVYDALRGLTEAVLPDRAQEITSVSWAPDGKRLVYVTALSQVIVYSLEHHRRIASWVVPGNTMPRAVHWTRDGRFILTGQAQADRLLRWDATTWALAGELPGVNWPHAISSSADGRYIVAADNARTLSVWDTQKKDALRQLKIPSLANALVAHPSRPWVLVNDFGGVEHNKGLLVDLESMRVLATHDSGSAAPRYAFSRDGEQVYVAEAEGVALLDGATLAPRGRISGAARPAKTLASDPQGGYVLTRDAEGVHVWDVTTGRKVHRWAGSFERLAAVEDAPGRFLVVEGDTAAQRSTLWELDTVTFTRRQVATLQRDVRALVARGGRAALITSAFVKPGQGEARGAMELYDLKTGASLRRAEVPLITEALSYGRAGGSWVSGFDVDLAREEFLLSTGWQDGFGMSATTPRYAHLYGFDGAVRRTFSAKEQVTNARFSGEEVVLVGDSAAWSYARQSGERLKSLPQRRGESLVYLPDMRASLVSSLSRVRYVPDAGPARELVAPGDDLIGAAAFPDRNLLVWLRRDNTLGFFTLDTFAPRLQLAARRGDAWIAWAEDGAFTASLGGSELAFWALGDLLLPLDALASRFEQPALIRQRLEAQLPATPGGSALPSGPSADLFAVPWSLTMASPAQAETGDATWTLHARLTRAAPGVELPELAFSIQGQELADARGFVRELPASKHVDELTDEFTRELPLQEGLNVIQVSLVHRGARLLTQTALITRTAEASPQASPTSDLYFLGIGVSTYKDPALNLSFSDKDAEALAKALQPQAGRLYRKVHTHLLLNADVTPQRIQVELHEFLRQSTPQDTIVIFIAGHGVQDNDQSLYFLTHDADPERPYTGVELSALHAFLKKRPPNQKALLWLDICHAGSYNADVKRRGRVTVEDAIQQLADGAGLVVLASSTGREFSLESARFGGGHGAFSAALLEALEGGADKEGNHDGTLTTTELLSFVSRRVPEMTQNQQHPTTPLVEHLRDFPLSLHGR